MISFPDVVIFENSIHDFIANKLISVHTPNSVLSKIALKFYQLQAENLCAFRLCLLPNCFLTAHSSREFVFFESTLFDFQRLNRAVFLCTLSHKKHTQYKGQTDGLNTVLSASVTILLSQFVAGVFVYWCKVCLYRMFHFVFYYYHVLT